MRILITGGAGMLARALLAELSGRGHETVALDRRALDVTDAAAVGEVVGGLRPDVVIQCAAYADVDGSEAREEYARLINADSARTAAWACSSVGARFVYPSTDYVFDGSGTRPYRTTDVPRPISAYGRSKLLGERAAAEAEDFLVVRTAWLYGPERRGFVRGIVERARRVAAGEPGPLRVVDDQRGAPTWTPSAAALIAGLIERRVPKGIWHATNAGSVTRYELALEALRLAGLADVPVEPVGSEEFAAPAPRPRYSVLDLSQTEAVLGPVRPWDDALAEAIGSGAY